MCGRFAAFATLEEITARFAIDRVNCAVSASYNIAPTQPVLAIARIQGGAVLDRYHWGLVPFWAADKAIGARLINARVETVAAKPAFRDALRKRRCLIVANGFFEWKGAAGQKQPYFITLPDGGLFGFSGLWDIWKEKDPAAAAYRSCTIITRAAAGPVSGIHSRMPVILTPAAGAAWLDPAIQDAKRLDGILADGAVTDLAFRPVSTRVNSVRNDTAENIIIAAAGV